MGVCQYLAGLVSYRGRRQIKNFVGPDAKRIQQMRSERSYERNIGRVTPARDDDPADPWNIVARIEGVPLAFQEDFDPGTEIHRIDDRRADVAEMAIDVARGNVEATTEGQREMSEVAADTDTLVERIERGHGRARLLIVELDVLMHEIADGLHTAPSRCERAEHVPSRLAQSVGFAIAAAHEIDEAFIGQVGGSNLPRARNGDLRLTGILDRRVAPERQIASGRHQPPALIAKKITIARHWNDGRGENTFGDANRPGVIVMQGQ